MGEVIKFDDQVEQVDLVVSVLDDRNEVQVPFEIINDMPRLTAFLVESKIAVPKDPNLTRNDSGTYVLHEQPVFG